MRILLLIATFLISACGVQGSLYLPEDGKPKEKVEKKRPDPEMGLESWRF